MAFDVEAVKRVEQFLYEIPETYRPDMLVPARLYADPTILEAAAADRSLEQLVNVATLPGIVGYALAMPDIHEGYGFPIGGVAATDVQRGVISPGGVGYDINCGVRLVRSNLDVADIRPYLGSILDAIVAAVPVGVGRGGDLRLKRSRLDDVLEGGAQWAVANGYGYQEDVDHCEERGRIDLARASAVSSKAKERGAGQLGTLGAGNHFLELDEVVEVYDERAADSFGLRPGQFVVQVHTGSRGLGHQVCTDYVRSFQAVVRREAYRLPDRELVCAPLQSKEGSDYLAAMSAAANYAWANRQIVMELVRRAVEDVLRAHGRGISLQLVYDVAHNIAKRETHEVGGKRVEVCVHRKGATRAFPPGHEAVAARYRSVGQPVLVPGNMGTASYVLRGTEQTMQLTFGSCCHGAGRTMSRGAARRRIDSRELRQALERQGIMIRAGSRKGLAEEAPDAYKDVHHVVDVVHSAGLALKVARLEPLGVVKG